MQAQLKRFRKREQNGQYAHTGNWDRLCVCGHTLGDHCAGSPADCLFYSFPESERRNKPGADRPNCGCEKFRLSRAKQAASPDSLVPDLPVKETK